MKPIYIVIIKRDMGGFDTPSDAFEVEEEAIEFVKQSTWYSGPVQVVLHEKGDTE